MGKYVLAWFLGVPVFVLVVVYLLFIEASSIEGEIMNKDQVKGSVKNAVGKVQEAAGKLVGSRKQEAKGLAKQVEGKTRKAYGDVKEAVTETPPSRPRSRLDH